MTTASTTTFPVMAPGRRNAAIAVFLVGLAVALYALFMIEGQVGILGLMPVFVFAIIALLGADIVLATIATVFLGAVMTGSSPIVVGKLLADSLGSFIAVVGMIIILGSGAGEVTARTGAANQLVRAIVSRIGLSNQFRVRLGIMVTSIIICGSLGTLAGGNAIIAAVVIPIAAAVRLSPPTVAALFQTSGATGLILGPFTPNVVTVMGLTGLSYPEYLMVAGIPMAIATLASGWFMAGRIQKMTGNTYQYDEIPTDNATLTSGSASSIRAAWAFGLTILVLAVVGVVAKAGFSFAIVVMISVAITTGLAGGMGAREILQAMYAGSGRLIWLFFLFWLFNPFLVMMDKLNAYNALLEAATPYLAGIGGATLCVIILWFNVIAHIPGAAVAQMTFTAKIFGPFLAAAGVGPAATAAVILGGAQIDWFGPFPTSDMFGQMGLARSSQIKYMLYNGWAVVVGNLLVFSALFYFLV